ncbi:MAG: hypothetical protein ABIB43_03560 [archaeon]
MYDIQQIQKINAMSQELKKFGFAADSTQGVESASGMLMNNEERRNSKVFTTEEEVVVELSNNFKRFKDMTAIRMNDMSKEIVNLNGQVKDLLKSISSLQNRPPTRIEQPQQATASPQETVNNSSEAKHESQERNSKPYNERQGKFSPGDVRIEDIFYCGRK